MLYTLAAACGGNIERRNLLKTKNLYVNVPTGPRKLYFFYTIIFRTVTHPSVYLSEKKVSNFALIECFFHILLKYTQCDLDSFISLPPPLALPKFREMAPRRQVHMWDPCASFNMIIFGYDYYDHDYHQHHWIWLSSLFLYNMDVFLIVKLVYSNMGMGITPETVQGSDILATLLNQNKIWSIDIKKPLKC